MKLNEIKRDACNFRAVSFENRIFASNDIKYAWVEYLDYILWLFLNFFVTMLYLFVSLIVIYEA